MRLVCHLRRLRGDRKLIDVSRETGIHIGELSRIERGIMLPPDDKLPVLEQVYGVSRGDFYASGTVSIVSDAEATA